jgi:hypothetical protein
MSQRKTRKGPDGGTYISCFRASTESDLAPLTIARFALLGRVRYLKSGGELLFHRADVMSLRHLARPMTEVLS